MDGCTHDGIAHSTTVDVGLVAQLVESLHHILVVVGILHDAWVEHRRGNHEFGIAISDDFGIVGIDQCVNLAGEETLFWYRS